MKHDSQKTVVVRTVKEAKLLREEWLGFRHSHGKKTPNNDPDRLLATISGKGAQPYIAFLYTGNEPRALILGRRVLRRRSCRVGYARIRTPNLGSLEIVYGGLITDRSPESCELVLEHLRSMLGNHEVDHISITCLPTQHDLWDPLLQGFNRCNRPVVEKIVHWETALLDANTEERIYHNSSRTRATLRRKARKLEKHFDGALSLISITETEQVSSFLAAADSITERTYHGALGVGLRNTSMWRFIFEAMAKTGNLRSYLLKGGGQPIAYVGGSVYGETFILESTAFLPELRHLSPGTVLMNQLFDDLAANGIAKCDFGFGDAEYKRLYGTHCWEEGNLDYYGSRAHAQLARGMNRMAQWMMRWGRIAADRLGALGRLRQRWRRKLEDT